MDEHDSGIAIRWFLYGYFLCMGVIYFARWLGDILSTDATVIELPVASNNGKEPEEAAREKMEESISNE